jgi:SAM-dependent methyltransferase
MSATAAEVRLSAIEAEDPTTGLAGFETQLYAYGLSLGLTLLRGGRYKQAAKYLVQPVPYWRSLEYRLVWGAGAFNRQDRVLDVGSPKLLSLYLAERAGAEVYATDIEDYFVDEYSYLRDKRGLSTNRFQVEAADGRALPYAEGTFTKVYSISVLEHIPNEGDAECARELGRVLAPGGKCLITVPFWPTSKDVYRRDFRWTAASVESSAGRFFQRRYSQDDLCRRLVEPSGLELEQMLFVGERLMTHNRNREFSEHLGLATSPLHPFLSRLVHTKPSTSWQALAKPLCAFLVLRKPRAGHQTVTDR